MPLFPSSAAATMITVESLRVRVRRLNELCIGLAKETVKPNAVDGDILHFVERDDYKQAIHDAVEGLERARVALGWCVVYGLRHVVG